MTSHTQRGQYFHLTWQCCSLCDWTMSLIINILISRDTNQPHTKGAAFPLNLAVLLPL